MLVINWKEYIIKMVMAYSEFLSWHLLVGTEQKHVNLNLGSWSKGQDLKLGHS